MNRVATRIMDRVRGKITDKIILVGFLGSGKEEISKQLSKKLNYSYIDVNDSIRMYFGEKISDFYKKEKVEDLRLAKENIARLLEAGSRCVIVSSEDVVLNEEIIDIMKKNKCFVVYVKASRKRIIENLIDAEDLCGVEEDLCGVEEDFQKSINTKLETLEKKYEEHSDYIVDVEEEDIDAIIKKIIKEKERVEDKIRRK